MENIISTLIGAAILIATAAISAYVIPWLRDKHLLSTVRTLVEAAEKLAENQPLDKKLWVTTQLKAIGVKITPFIDAAIESAVKQLDIAIGMASTPDLDALFSEIAPKE